MTRGVSEATSVPPRTGTSTRGGLLGEGTAPKWKVTVAMVMANEEGASRRSLGSCQSHQTGSHQISEESQKLTTLPENQSACEAFQ